MAKLTPIKKIPHFAVIIRAIWERGQTQREALDELEHRGLWLNLEQRRQAGIEE